MSGAHELVREAAIAGVIAARRKGVVVCALALIREAAIAVVIALAIGLVIMAVLIMGMFIMYNDERDRIAQQRETSTEIQGERIREDIGMQIGIDGSINFTNDWGAATSVEGIMVRCDNGTVITSDIDFRIPSTGGMLGNDSDISIEVDGMVQRLLAQC